MNETNSQQIIQIFAYLILFALLAFAIWGVYRAYKQRQLPKAGVVMSLGAAVGGLAGLLLGNANLGLLLGIAIGFAVGAGLQTIN